MTTPHEQPFWVYEYNYDDSGANYIYNPVCGCHTCVSHPSRREAEERLRAANLDMSHRLVESEQAGEQDSSP